MANTAQKFQENFTDFFECISSSPRFQREMDEIWSAIQARLGDRPRCSFLVTSATIGEGKTTLSMGLAKFVAEYTGRQVLLVEADWRGNPIREFLRDTDLIPLIEEPLDRYEVTFDEFATRFPHLNYMRFRNPQALETLMMQTEAITSFMDLIRKRYDYVFLDAPAVLVSNVSSFLSRQVDNVIFVVASGEIGYPVLQEALTRFGTSRDKIVGAVLNKRQYPVPQYVYRLIR